MQRDLANLVVPSEGGVRVGDGVVPWLVYDQSGEVVEPIAAFLRDFLARDNSPGSVRSYAFGLLRWWRWLAAAGVDWDCATSAEVRDLVLWLQLHPKTRRSPRSVSVSATTAGTVNQLTGKRSLTNHFAARTIRHSNAVIASFYDYWAGLGVGPVVNPVVRERAHGGSRPGAHHNPMELHRAEGRLRYNPRIPKRRPRSLNDQAWNELFEALGRTETGRCCRWRSATVARAAELFGLRLYDVNWGDQLVRVVRKGTRAEQWLPVSPDSVSWLRLYLAEVGDLEPLDALWSTLRRRTGGEGLARQPMTYEMLRRANAKLGTNWSMHDLRHTCALRMAGGQPDDATRCPNDPGTRPPGDNRRHLPR